MDQTTAEEKTYFYSWPGGMRSVAGGTRTGIKLDRPWQTKLNIGEGKCPFCGGPNDREKTFHPENGGWWSFKNIFTPHPFHMLIVPNDCWPEEKLRQLGGEENIRTALDIATDIVKADPHRPLFVLVHVGYLAGQNVPHLHYHVVQYIHENRTHTKKDNWSKSFEFHKDLVLWDTDYLTVAVGGVRAGQCVLLPKDNLEKSNFTLEKILSEYLGDLVSLGNRKFKSKQGMPPDFAIMLHFNNGFQYGLYVPILNQWGSAEQAALYENCELTLPWPHEQTVEFLKS